MTRHSESDANNWQAPSFAEPPTPRVCYRDLFEKVPVGVFVVDAKGCVLDCNETFLGMAGAPRERVIGFDLLGSSRDPALIPYLRRALAGERVEFDTPYTSTTGDKASHYYYAFHPLDASSETPALLLCFAQDVARLKVVEAANDALRISEEKFAKAFRNGPDPMILSEIETGRMHDVNESFSRVFGYSRDASIGYTTLEIGLWPDETARQQAVALVREHGVIGSREIEMRSKDGRILTMLGSAARIEIAGVPFWLVQLRDISERKQLELEIERQARTDYLTGIANRRHFMACAELEFARAKRYSRPLSLLMIDVDHFKRVNDSEGHLAGDEVLKEIASRCAPLMREHDLLGRFGGEEFAVLLPETALSEALRVAERIRLAASAQPAALSGNRVPISVTVSLGAAEIDGVDASLADILRRGDHALYEAKSAGRNCCRPLLPC